MPLINDAAQQFINDRRDEINAMSEADRDIFIDEVINTVSQNPALNINQPTSEKTAKALEAANIESDKISSGTGTRPRKSGDPTFTGDSLTTAEQAARLNQKKLERDAELESQGVVIDSELPAGDLELGFGVDPVKDLKNVLSEHFKTDVPVFKSGNEVIYIDPTNGKAVKANPGALSHIGRSLPAVGEIGAAFATKGRGSVAKVVAQESLAAGGGGGAGEFIRLAIGKGLGVHDLPMEEMIKKTGVQALWSGGVTLGIGTLISSIKGIANFRAGRVFNKEDALDVGIKVDQADEVVAEVNKLLPERKGFKPTLAQKGDDTLAESAEAELRGRSEHAQRFRARDVENTQAEQAALEKIGQPELKPLAPSTVSEVAERRVAEQVATKAAPVKASQKQLESQLDEIGKVQKENVGKPTLEVIKAKETAANDAINAKWEDVRTTGGFNPETKTFGIEIAPQSPTKELGNILERQAKTARTSEGASATKSFFNKDKPADLGDFNSEISRLKARLRKMDKGPQVSNRDAADVREVIKTMEQDRALALTKAGKMDLLKKIKAAEVETAKFHDTFKRSVIGDLTEQTPNGTPKIKSQTFVDDVMKRDDSEIDDFFSMINDNPDLKMKWKQGIGDKYKREVFPEGKDGVKTFSPRKNQEFIKRNEHALRKVFTDEEIKGFLRTGKLHEKVAAQTKQLEKFIKEAETKWGAGKLSKLDPDSLNKFVTNNKSSWITPKGQGVQNNVSKIRFVKKMTRKDPGAWQAFQNNFKKSLQKDLTNVETGKINSKKMAEWAQDNKQTIVEVMGDQYHKDLVKIGKVVKMLNKPMNRLAAEEARSAWIQSIRAGVAPPLTRRGRAFTALILFDKKAHHKATIDALLDQKTMHEVAKLSEHDVVTRRVMEKAFSLGLGTDEE